MQQLQVVWQIKHWLVRNQKIPFHLVLPNLSCEGSFKLKKLAYKEVPVFHTQGPEGQSQTPHSVPWDMHQQRWLLPPVNSLLPLSRGEEHF